MPRDQVFLLTDDDLVAVVTLALHCPIRTVAQQEALLRVCEALDNDFVKWSHDATTTWEGRRCTCGRAIPVTVDNCSGCTRSGVPA
jgi:hypothetical protein